MLIQINRVYVSSGIESTVLYNTRYIVSITPLPEGYEGNTAIKTRIVYREHPEDKIIYSTDSLKALQGRCKKK